MYRQPGGFTKIGPTFIHTLRRTTKQLPILGKPSGYHGRLFFFDFIDLDFNLNETHKCAVYKV